MISFTKAAFALLSLCSVSVVANQAEAASASIIPTGITITNNTTAPVKLIGKVNISGEMTPAALGTIEGSKSYIGTSRTTGVMDGGTLQYGPCRFHWSTMQTTNPMTGAVSWSFSQTASPATKCKAVSNTANYTTGEHAVTFSINN